MENITTPRPIQMLNAGQVIIATTSPLPRTVLVASVKHPMTDEAHAVWVVLLVNSSDTVTPFSVHLAHDTANGWALEYGYYHRTLSDALGSYDNRTEMRHNWGR